MATGVGWPRGNLGWPVPVPVSPVPANPHGYTNPWTSLRVPVFHPTSATYWDVSCYLEAASYVCSVWKSGLRTGKRPQLDRTGPEKRPDCSLGLWYLKIKDRKKTGLFGPVQTGLNRSFVPPIYPFKMSQRSCKLMKNWLRYSKFCQKRVRMGRTF